MSVLPPLYPKDFKDDCEMKEYAQKIMQEKKTELCELY
jgi:hypothetical protein